MEQFQFYLGKNTRDTVYSGEWLFWDSLGTLRSRKRYRDGLLHGHAEDFFPNGKIRVDLFYNAGKLDSGIFWDESGKVTMRFRPGPIDDTVYNYDSDGDVEKVLRPRPEP